MPDIEIDFEAIGATVRGASRVQNQVDSAGASIRM